MPQTVPSIVYEVEPLFASVERVQEKPTTTTSEVKLQGRTLSPPLRRPALGKAPVGPRGPRCRVGALYEKIGFEDMNFSSLYRVFLKRREGRRG